MIRHTISGQLHTVQILMPYLCIIKHASAIVSTHHSQLAIHAEVRCRDEMRACVQSHDRIIRSNFEVPIHSAFNAQ